MPDIVEVQLVRSRNFTVGADVHKGLTAVTIRKNAPETLAVMKEDDMAPSAYHQLPSERPNVELTIRSKSYQALNSLAGTQAATATFDAEEAGTSNTVTVTLTNPIFEGADGGIQGRSVDGFSLQAKATAVAFA
ncbi:MAG: hypothetical protein AAGA29_05915 [Planctomycetota bacterium]